MKKASAKKRLRLPSKLYLVVARDRRTNSVHAMSAGLIRKEAAELHYTWTKGFCFYDVSIEGPYER
jgi:hypothetical protein